MILKLYTTCDIHYTTNLKFSRLLVVIIIDIMFEFNLSARLYYIVPQTLSLWYLLQLPSEAARRNTLKVPQVSIFFF